MAYIGNQADTAFTSLIKQDLTGASGTSLTLTHAVANANDIALYINNVRQEPVSAYSTNGTAVSLTGSVVSSDDIYVIYLARAVQTTVPPDGSVSTAKIADSAVTSAKLDTNITVTGQITETGKEYFHVDLTTAQTSIADNTKATVDFGGKGTVKYDTKSNFDSSNDAYLLDSSDGVYLISYSVCITSDDVTTETLIDPTALVRVATDGSTFVGVHGSANHVQNNAGDELGSLTLSGTFIYKSTNATTKIQLLGYSNQTGGAGYKFQNNVAGGVNTESGTTLGTDGTSARPTFLTIVRIA